MCINNVKYRCGKWSLFSFALRVMCACVRVCVCVCSDVNKMRCFTGLIYNLNTILYNLSLIISEKNVVKCQNYY